MAGSKYGKAHHIARAQWQAVVDNGDAYCCHCNQWIAPGSAWDLDHVPGTSEYRGPACPSCNRSDGATRGNQMRAGTYGGRWAI